MEFETLQKIGFALLDLGLAGVVAYIWAAAAWVAFDVWDKFRT